jgi:hypothetical protein
VFGWVRARRVPVVVTMGGDGEGDGIGITAAHAATYRTAAELLNGA